ncbi:MAG: UDP-4-amino-4,6-dideoxy-N-acetyl-beta-L-altrosamine N-acetyltransferase [Sphingomonadales bacterium]
MIELRDVTSGDRDMVRSWRNQPSVGRYMYSDHFISPGEHEGWFENAMADPARKYWIIVCDDEDVGLANVYGINEDHRRCYWAFYIAKSDLRGKGVGSFVEFFILRYVFEELGLNRLCCEVLANNPAVVEMHKRFGFHQEGIFRQHICKGEEWLDVVTLSMLASEWQSVKPGIEERLRGKGLLAPA